MSLLIPWLRRVCLALVLPALAPPAPCQLAAPQLVLDPPAADFGDRGQNERPEASITLRNAGTSALTVRGIKKSCDCLEFSPAAFPQPIPPGGTVALKVSMGSGRAMGRLEKHLTILTDAPGTPEVSLPIGMRVFEQFELEPRSVRLEGACGQPLREWVEVKLRNGVKARPFQLQVKAIRGSFGRPSGEYLRATVEKPGGGRIAIDLDPRHPEGQISAELEASLDGKGLFIPISGEMFAWIKVSPSYLNFSRAVESDPATQRREIVLSSTDGRPFKVEEVTSRPHREGEKGVRLELACEPAPPAIGPAAVRHRLLCRVVRIEPGDIVFSGTVVVRTDHPQKPSIVIRYSGLSAR